MYIGNKLVVGPAGTDHKVAEVELNTYITFPDSDNWDIFGSNSDDWTIDFWVQHKDHLATETYITQVEDSSNRWYIRHTHGSGIKFRIENSGGTVVDSTNAGEITDTDWHHIAFIKVGSTYSIYKDGSQIIYTSDTDTDTLTGTLYIGSDGLTTADYFKGSMEEFRVIQSNAFSASPVVGLTDTITVPTNPYVEDEDTRLLLHFENLDLTISKEYPRNVVTNSGTINMSLPVFGDGARLFDGSNDYLSIPDSSDWDVISSTSSDYTIDFWLKLNSNSTTMILINQHHDDNLYWRFQCTSGELRFYGNDGSATLPIDTGYGGSLSTGVWYHISFCKVGSTSGIYIDGTQVAYDDQVGTASISQPLEIGRRNRVIDPWHLDGSLDDLRMHSTNIFSATPNASKTDTITVPTSAHIEDDDTNLLLHFDNDIIDSSYSILEPTNYNLVIASHPQSISGSVGVFGGASTSSLEISGLRGDTDFEYVIEGLIYNSSASTAEYGIQFNNDTTTNYAHNYVRGNGNNNLSNAKSTSTKCLLHSTTASKWLYFKGHIIAKSGNLRVCKWIIGTEVIEASVDMVEYFVHESTVWGNTADEITSIKLISSVANSIGSGSKLVVYRGRI